MTHYTPAPWRLSEIDGSLDIIDADGIPLAHVRQLHDAEDYPNARLLTAAPELLAASKLLAAWVDARIALEGEDWLDIQSQALVLAYRKALAAIAVATAEPT